MMSKKTQKTPSAKFLKGKGTDSGNGGALGSQVIVGALAIITLVLAFSLNLGDIAVKESELKDSPEIQQQEVIEALDNEETRTELALQTEATSPSLEHVTGEGEPFTISGKGTPEKEILLKKPDGPHSPAWVEYTVTYASRPFMSGRISFYGTAAEYENGRYFTLNVTDYFVSDHSNKEPYTRTGSFWLAGDADVPVRMSDLADNAEWTVTVHSAKDAPVLRPGDSLSGTSSQGVHAFRYIADKPTKVQATTHQPVSEEENERLRSFNNGLSLMWIDSDDYHEAVVQEQTVLSLAYNHRFSKLSQADYEGSTELLPGDYLMSARALGEDLNLSFTEAGPTIEGEYSAYALNPAEPIDELSGETGLAEDDFLALKVMPAGPRLMHFSAEGPQAGDTFSLYNPASTHGILQTSSWSYDDVNGVILIPANQVGGRYELGGSNPWKITTYSVDAIPTYKPGDRISGTGPMLFYLEPGQDVTARLERENNGDDRGRSRLRVYSAEGPLDSRSPSTWLELYTTSLSSTSIEIKLQQTDEPALFYFDISATVSWKLALEGR